MTTRVVCWNIARRPAPWDELLSMGADVALLQEAGPVPEDAAAKIDTGSREHWDSHVWNSDWYSGRWDRLYDRWPLVVKLSDRVEVEWFKQVSAIGEPEADEVAVSGIGTIAAARVVPEDGQSFIAVSMYARWLRPHSSTNSRWKIGYSDASAHRIISDLSAFIGDIDPSTHRILAAGDLNMIYGATDDNHLALPARERTVYDRMDALGLEFIGPQHPAGVQANPTPHGLPPDTLNVPTYFDVGKSPETAYKQLDYVFASRGFHEQVTVRAMNSPEEWGSSDHCRLWIEVEA
ncbi:endonuclease/exonuclease/phosphatase family protein [Candidatus Poriferisocius sp.]|uniref:endonuclease/exonuclease/phosphatase family protein n=1 Tax=Candidatus Poriferisocius sp. TaxID=3101276 RepID=UPI003B594B0E